MARPKAEKTKVVVTFSIDEDVNDDIAMMAEKMGISKSAVVNMLLRGVCYQEMGVLKELGKVVAQQRTHEKRGAQGLVTA